MHYRFKSYGDFAEWSSFAHWWSFIGKGLRLQPAQQAGFISLSVEMGSNFALELSRAEFKTYVYRIQVGVSERVKAMMERAV